MLLSFLMLVGMTLPGFAQNAVFRLNGPANSQPAFLTFCGTAVKGLPTKSSCQVAPAGTVFIELNKDIPVQSGLYSLSWNSGKHSQFVNILPEDHQVVNLVEFSLPTQIPTKEFWIFLDYTDSKMQENRLLHLFAKKDSDHWQELMAENCQMPANAKACDIYYHAKSHRDLLGTVIQFLPDGSVSSWNYSRGEFTNYERNSFNIHSGPKEQKVYLLPGTYGILYKDETGNWISQKGITL